MFLEMSQTTLEHNHTDTNKKICKSLKRLKKNAKQKPKGAILINNVILGLKSIATFKVINIYEKKPLVFMRRYKCNCHPWSRNPLRHYSCTFSLKGGNILTQ